MKIESHHIRMLATMAITVGWQGWGDIIVNWVAEEFDTVHGDNRARLQSYQDSTIAR